MAIYLMRHGQAVAGDFQTPDDARWLTTLGREAALAAGKALHGRGGVELIVTSPLVRAVQTAELIASVLQLSSEIQALSCLRSEMPAQRAVDTLRALGYENVLAVSHEPIVSSIAALLSGQRPDEGRGFRTAELRAFQGGKNVWHHRG